MRKINLLPLIFLGVLSYGQVGINNVTPKITLDVTSKTADGSTSEGFMLPRITGNALKAAETAGAYTNNQHSALVFVTAVPDPDNRTGQVEGMDAPGFYYFDAGSNRWVKMISSGTSTAAVTQLLCSGSSNIGILVSGEVSAGVSTSIPYSGGNGGVYSALSVPSIGVTGLIATLPSGTLNNGSGTLTFNIIGTPSAAGTATFDIDFAGQTCGFSMAVQPPSNFPDTAPIIINGQARQIMTHNLGGDITQDPNVPTQSIMGNYYQWGKKNAIATAYTNANTISGWSTSGAADKAWNSGTEAVPAKTANDPCPVGFRVPTQNEWNGFNTASTKSNIGTWATTSTNGATNFSAAKVFVNNGNQITFPTAGYRDFPDGLLGGRAFGGYYWSNTEAGVGSIRLNFTNSAVTASGNSNRVNGFSVRCISE